MGCRERAETGQPQAMTTLTIHHAKMDCPERAETGQPRATPWGKESQRNASPERAVQGTAESAVTPRQAVHGTARNTPRPRIAGSVAQSRNIWQLLAIIFITDLRGPKRLRTRD